MGVVERFWYKYAIYLDQAVPRELIKSRYCQHEKVSCIEHLLTEELAVT
jgi:hypothetical protein